MSRLMTQNPTPGSQVTLANRSMRLFDLFKRSQDVFLSLIALVLAMPVLLVCSVIIKISDPGPATYSQWRVGLDGRMFRIFKLRTMVRSAENKTGAVCAAKDDQRVIGWCRWMRRSHIDELPQLWNIFMGDMSLVGPRPEQPEIHEKITNVLPHFNDRLAVKPGLTGLAQVRNGYTNDLAGSQRKLAFDLQYIQQMNWVNEIKLLFMTLPKFWDREAC